LEEKILKNNCDHQQSCGSNMGWNPASLKINKKDQISPSQLQKNNVG
jgi:hypothetical protein